jgi:hypothetical protein
LLSLTRKILNGHLSHVTFNTSLPILNNALYQFVPFCTVICRKIAGMLMETITNIQTSMVYEQSMTEIRTYLREIDQHMSRTTQRKITIESYPCRKSYPCLFVTLDCEVHMTGTVQYCEKFTKHTGCGMRILHSLSYYTVCNNVRS